MAEAVLPASLAAFGFPPRPASAVVVEQTPGQRFGRTAAGLATWWGLALAGLFIPVAHFILVPTFLIGGVIVAIKRSREDRRLLRIRGTCPRCGTPEELTPGGRFVSGRSLDCPACHGNLTLVAAA